MSKTRKASIINGFRTWLKTRITPKDTALTPTVRLSSFGVPLDGYSYTSLSARLHAAPGLCTLFCWLLCNLLLFILRTFSFRPCFAPLLSGSISQMRGKEKRVKCRLSNRLPVPVIPVQATAGQLKQAVSTRRRQNPKGRDSQIWLPVAYWTKKNERSVEPWTPKRQGPIWRCCEKQGA